MSLLPRSRFNLRSEGFLFVTVGYPSHPPTASGSGTWPWYLATCHQPLQVQDTRHFLLVLPPGALDSLDGDDPFRLEIATALEAEVIICREAFTISPGKHSSRDGQFPVAGPRVPTRGASTPPSPGPRTSAACSTSTVSDGSMITRWLVRPHTKLESRMPVYSRSSVSCVLPRSPPS